MWLVASASFMLANGAALLFGGGLALAALTWERAARAGSVLSTYGALALAGVAILEAVMANEVFRSHTGLANYPLCRGRNDTRDRYRLRRRRDRARPCCHGRMDASAIG